MHAQAPPSSRCSTTFTVLSTLLIASLTSIKCLAADPIIPGTLSSPFPTFENLSFEWEFTGDDNGNAAVAIQYRPLGDTNWLIGMPLRRIPGGSNVGHSWTTKYSGSLFGLNPGTNYEVQLMMDDANGGSAQQTLHVATRALPNLSRGTIVELPPGPYGELNVTSGTPDNPMIYRSQSRNNPAQVSMVNMQNVHDVYVIGLEINNPNGDGIRAHGSSNFVIARNTINARHGIRALNDATNGYIVDNRVQGQTTWVESSLGASGNNIGEGIEISGPGNVIAYNTVRGFRDNISTLEFEGAPGDQRSIDIHNNDLLLSADDAIEADFVMGNVRVTENRITDAFVGISTQPSLGGPTYVMRNVMYNVTNVPLKPHRNSEGDVFIHNTIVKAGSGLYTSTDDAYSNVLFRNNLAIGGEDVGPINGFNIGNSRPADLQRCDGTCDYDFDAVGVTTAATSPNGARIYNPNSTPFLTVEANGMILTDIDAANMSPLFPGVAQPATKPQVLAEHSPPDLRPGNSASIEGQAELIPGINDGFLGTGPDMGAYEVGQSLPSYGQRELIAGDFNYDYTVDASDFTVWRDSLGVNAGGDADGDGDTDDNDRAIWEQNFGQSAAATAQATALPEPAGGIIFPLATAILLLRLRRHRRGSFRGPCKKRLQMG